MINKNTLYFGDNLEVMKNFKDEIVDLVYLDPPFQSGRDYNIIFENINKNKDTDFAQAKAFSDTWYWGEEAQKEYEGLINGSLTRTKPSVKLIQLMQALRSYLGESSMMAYLTMMAPRLLEIQRVLKNTGSVYLHCDPTASHYLKLLMDAIFGANNFRNEIVWHYRTGGVSKRWFASKHDIILFYSKTDAYIFNPIEEKVYYEKGFKPRLEDRKLEKDENGYYRYVYKDDVWDIPAVFNMSKEYIGYPTQKPEKLLEVIITASSKPGSVILDPFCGCGTAIAVAQKTERKWIGIDISYLAIDIIVKRLNKTGLTEGKDFKIEGAPADLTSAEKLAQKDPFQFQNWAISKIPNAIPNTKKTGDKGVDGYFYFFDRQANKVRICIISVKGTKKVVPSFVRDLIGTIQSQNADFGILITLAKPTKNVHSEALKQGHVSVGALNIPKVQVISVEKLFENPLPLVLPIDNAIKPYNISGITPHATKLPFSDNSNVPEEDDE